MTDQLPIVALDTETTSLVPPFHPQGRQTWEVGGIRRDPDGAHTAFLFHLPVDLTHANPEALRIGGYYERSPHEGHHTRTRDHEKAVKALGLDRSIYYRVDAGIDPYYREFFLDRLWGYLNGATVVGSNPGFDTTNVSHILTKAGMPGHLIQPWHYKPYNIAEQGAAVLGQPGTGMSTKDLSREFGIERPVEHTALADAVWALNMRDAIEEKKLHHAGFMAHPRVVTA